MSKKNKIILFVTIGCILLGIIGLQIYKYYHPLMIDGPSHCETLENGIGKCEY